jgi:hypothetical protein
MIKYTLVKSRIKETLLLSYLQYPHWLYLPQAKPVDVLAEE